MNDETKPIIVSETDVISEMRELLNEYAYLTDASVSEILANDKAAPKKFCQVRAECLGPSLNILKKIVGKE